MKIIITLFLLIYFAHANTEKVEFYSQYDHIFKKYEKEYGISYFLVKAIAMTENNKFNPKAIMQNTNGTKDIGLMQINTAWKKWMPSANITIKKLKNPDFNIKVSFLILKDIIKRHGYSWDSVGRYHSGTPKYKRIWLKRIKSNIRYLAKIDGRVKIVI